MKRNKTHTEDERSFIEIDPLALDREWVNQPRLYLQYSEELANAGREMDEAKSNLDITKADLEQQIRSDPDEFGLEKVTESAVNATMLTQPEYKSAMAALIDARHRRDILGAAVSALEHRKKALEKLVDLHLAGYFAAPRASAGSREAAKEIEDRAVRRPLKQRVKE